MPFCSNCGEEYTLGDKFCSGCGSKIGDATATPVELEEEETIWEGRPSGLTSGITSSTLYILTNQRLRILSGRLSKKEEEIELIRIKDIRVKQGLMDRAKGIGDVEVVSADETTPNLVLKDIKDPVGVKETIRNAVRAERSNKLRYQERL